MAFLLPRAAVVRRTSCGLPESAVVRVAHASAPLRSLSLGRRRSTQACCARSRRAALLVVNQRTRLGYRTFDRPLSFRTRPWCDIPAAASQNQPLFAWHTQARHCARCLSGGGAARKLAARARGAGLVMAVRHTRLGYCAFERPFCFGARPWCNVPAAASQNQPVFAWHTRARHFARCLSGGGAARRLAARACRAGLVVVGRRTRYGYCTGKRPFSFGARPWCDVLAAPPQNQPVFTWHMRARRCAHCFSGGSVVRSLAARARCAALVVIGRCTR